MMKKTITLLAVLMISGSAFAKTQMPTKEQPEEPKLNPHQAKFMNKCNPDQQEILGAMCGCVMSGIEVAMPIQEFNGINERDEQKQLSRAEIAAIAKKLRRAQPHIRRCAGG